MWMYISKEDSKIMFERLEKISAIGTKYYGFIFYGLAMNLRAQTTVEIGLGHGYISGWLVHAMYQTGGIHHAIDNQPLLARNFRHLVNLWNYRKNCQIHEGNSLAISWNKEIDFLFIDGDHSEKHLSVELEKYVPYVKQDRYLALHDYNNPDKPGVKNACNKMLSPRKWEKIFLHDFNRYNHENGVLLCRKK